MFYVIAYTDVSSRLNWDHVDISKSPARTNSSHEICTDGWCGSTNDVSVCAHGEFKTEIDARNYIEKNFETRGFSEYCKYGLDEWQYDEDVIDRFMIGEVEDMDESEVGDFIYEYMMECVTASTTDEEILALEEELERERLTL